MSVEFSSYGMGYDDVICRKCGSQYLAFFPLMRLYTSIKLMARSKNSCSSISEGHPYIATTTVDVVKLVGSGHVGASTTSEIRSNSTMLSASRSSIKSSILCFKMLRKPKMEGALQGQVSSSSSLSLALSLYANKRGADMPLLLLHPLQLP